MARQNLGTHFFPFTNDSTDRSDGTGQFRFVKLSGTAGDNNLAKVTRATTAGERVIGILQDRPKAGEQCTVLLLNAPCVAKVVAGGTIAIGDRLATDSQGRAIVINGTAASVANTNTSDAGVANDPLTGYFCVGVALQATSTAGDYIEMLLMPIGFTA